jgi:BASS family bile acid:Na+ symporter
MSEFYLRHEYWFAGAQLCFAMLGMGATLRPGDFAGVVREPGAFALGIVVQSIGVPLIAALLCSVLSPVAGIAAGIALVAAVPGGAMSNLWAFLARGNVPLSIALTAVTTLGCLISTPLVLAVLARPYLAGAVEMPAGRIAVDIAGLLLIPLAVGMIVGARRPDWRARFSVWCIRISLAVIACIIVGAAGAGRIDAMSYGIEGLVVILLFAAAAQLTAIVPARLLRLTRRDAVTLAIEATVRNTNLGLLIKASVFPALPEVADPIADGVLFVALLYGGMAPLVILPVVFWGRGSA